MEVILHQFFYTPENDFIDCTLRCYQAVCRIITRLQRNAQKRENYAQLSVSYLSISEQLVLYTFPTCYGFREDAKQPTGQTVGGLSYYYPSSGYVFANLLNNIQNQYK